MYAQKQSQQYEQSLKTRLFDIGKVTGYLKSHLSPKPSLQARLRGRAKNLEDFIAECKRREINKAAIISEEERRHLYDEGSIDGRNEFYTGTRFLVTAKSEDGKITFSEEVAPYTYDGRRVDAVLGITCSYYDQIKKDIDKVRAEWKEELSKQGIEEISSWYIGKKI